MARFTYRSGTLKPYQLVLVCLAGAIITMLLIILVFSVFNRAEVRPDAWYFIDGFSHYRLVNYVILAVASLLGGIFYYYREYRYYNALTFRIEDEHFAFSYPDSGRDERFPHSALAHLKTSMVFYGWLGYIKVVLRFNDPRTKGKKTRYVLIKKDDIQTFTEQMKTVKQEKR